MRAGGRAGLRACERAGVHMYWHIHITNADRSLCIYACMHACMHVCICIDRQALQEPSKADREWMQSELLRSMYVGLHRVLDSTSALWCKGPVAGGFDALPKVLLIFHSLA